MEFAVGVVLFALGIILSICLHEAGHLGTAKGFGMLATQYFVGFGPTLWSFRRGETEYGIKALPVGGFVRIAGWTPDAGDVPRGQEHRAMWRFPVWKRTVVMGAGSAVHFVLGFALLWGVFAFAPINDFDKLDRTAPTVESVTACAVPEWRADPATGGQRECAPGDPPSAAAAAGLRPGDVIVAFDGVPVTGWADLTSRVRAAGGQTVTLTYERDGVPHEATVELPVVERPREDLEPGSVIGPGDLERVGFLGVTPVIPRTVFGPVDGLGMAADRTVALFRATVEAVGRLPERIPDLWHAVLGGERDPETPMSVVGASRIGGELWERGELPTWLVFLAGVNFFVGVFNLVPLLPLDGGHIAIAWFERARSWVYVRLGRPDPGRVDYDKLMPVTYVVILIMAGFFLLTVAADIISPVQLPF
ncbi:MAG: M50 family metallopeptidase [Micromonosporaceae bacterium]|jgi:membrane-associated protease RseP (regulator of RpoE activity)